MNKSDPQISTVQISLKTSILQAAGLFMAKTDPRKWINGITIEICPAAVKDQHKATPPLARLYATNGQIMFVHSVAPLDVTGYNGKPTSIIIPATFVEKLLKSALSAAKAIARDQSELPRDKKTVHTVSLRFAEGTVALTNAPGRPDPNSLRTITARHAGATQALAPAEDTIDLDSKLEAVELYAPAPDHSQSIPTELDGQVAYYSPQHCQTISRAHELVTADPRVEFRGISQNGQGPGLACIDERTIALVIPVRPYLLPEKHVPEWATISLASGLAETGQKTPQTHADKGLDAIKVEASQPPVTDAEPAGELRIARAIYIQETEESPA